MISQGSSRLGERCLRSNVLYFGDNLDVLRERIPNESVDLIYLDPPFSSARNYFVIFKDRGGGASRAQEEAFSDTWAWGEDADQTYRELVLGRSGYSANHELGKTVEAFRTLLKESPMMAYLVSMAVRLAELHRVLKPTGSLYLHCDPTASHYLKILLDTIFGPERFRNEIVWKRTSAHGNASRNFGNLSDTILVYSKTDDYTFHVQHTPYDPEYIRKFYRHVDEAGRRYRLDNLRNPAVRPNLMYEYKGYKPHPNGWAMSKQRMEQLDAEGRLYFPKNPEGRIQLKRFLDEMPGVAVGSVWDDIMPIGAQAAERLGYPTQKPLALLERIIAASSNEGDVVLDPYCGCGTTVIAAHKLHRDWIGIDITAVSVGIIKSRLEQTFPELHGKVEVDGFPRDLEGARVLFETDPYRFQVWACTLIGAYPLTKKGADKGIDGWLTFADLRDEPQRAVVQVKGGKLTASQVRDFCHVVAREKAALGFLLTMGDISSPMKTEALTQGYWDGGHGREYPKVQLLSIPDLLTGTVSPRMPIQEKKSLLGYAAKREERRGTQRALELEL